jgi:uncharacterized protein YjbI with pentapeptide repeats
VTVTELKELLGQHRELLESKGQTGERASYHRALLPDANLRGADFSQAIRRARSCRTPTSVEPT